MVTVMFAVAPYPSIIMASRVVSPFSSGLEIHSMDTYSWLAININRDGVRIMFYYL